MGSSLKKEVVFLDSKAKTISFYVSSFPRQSLVIRVVYEPYSRLGTLSSHSILRGIYTNGSAKVSEDVSTLLRRC